MSLLSVVDFEEITFNHKQISLTTEQKENLKKSFDFLKSFSSDKIIYGINTGFGPMAQFRVGEVDQIALQYNLIRSHCTGLGNSLDPVYSRAVLLSRLNSFLQFKSGVSPAVVEKLLEFLNTGISPEIFEHGSVGASGDLVQLAHLALNLIGEGHVYYQGKRRVTKTLLKELNISPLSISLRDGLGLINGTSCMTGIGLVNIVFAKKLINWAIICSSIINEIVESYDDSISSELNTAKLHSGQQKIASTMRSMLSDSKLIKSRNELFEDPKSKERKIFDKKIQEYYSIRCVPQILGPVLDTIDFAEKVLENELNSTNDNPVVDTCAGNVFHGGNFHGDYVSLEMDKLKIALTKMSILSERQLNFLLNPSLNKQFPPFLNTKRLGFNFGLQGAQFTATSTVAENQTLSFPNSIHSIPNNNDNQDVVSMGTNSAILTAKVVENCFQVIAIHLLAICQAIEFLDKRKQEKLSTNATRVYNRIRNIVPKYEDDRVLSSDIQSIIELIKTNNIET